MPWPPWTHSYASRGARPSPPTSCAARCSWCGTRCALLGPRGGLVLCLGWPLCRAVLQPTWVALFTKVPVSARLVDACAQAHAAAALPSSCKCCQAVASVATRRKPGVAAMATSCPPLPACSRAVHHLQHDACRVLKGKGPGNGELRDTGAAAAALAW